MFDCAMKRLEDPELISEVVQTLMESGFDRAAIEDALIQQAPVDLDLLAECYEKLTRTLALVHGATQERAA
ncbi:hypothetical protein [Jiella sp. M17.18]|uniref:hypothetical protein n=1 Tax=Jiella sp. M17.18 TaxID=3234247 RepID=UPI0034DE9F89